MSNFILKLLNSCPELGFLENDLEEALARMIESYRKGGKILTCGNGGSAADSEHIVAELMKGFLLRRPLLTKEKEKLKKGGCSEKMIDELQRPIPAVSLVAGIALSTAFQNDVNPQLIFAQQILGLGKPEDLLMAISTSGNSPNIIAGCKVAKALAIPIIGLTGKNTCLLDTLSDVAIKVPSSSTPEIQEYHVRIYHALCAELENNLFAHDK